MQISEETAVVEYIDEGFVHLVTNGQSSCSGCSAKATCGSVRLGSRIRSSLKVKSSLDLKEGDTVIIGLAANRLFLGTLLVYFLPLFSLLSFASLGEIIYGEVLSIILGICSLLLTLLFVNKFLNHNKSESQFEPKIIRKIIKINNGSSK